MAANQEKYAKAEKYLSSEAKTAIQEATELAGGIRMSGIQKLAMQQLKVLK